jgi:hypothetical protein
MNHAASNPASDWTLSHGADLRSLLLSRPITYDDGARQSFAADGSTNHTDRGGPTVGLWHLEGEQFLSNWPPSTHWVAYRVFVIPGRDRLHFVASGGEAFAGRFD